MTGDGQKKQGPSMPLMLALIVLLLLGVRGVFGLLGTIAPQQGEQLAWETLLTTAGQPGSYEMRLLEEQERQEGDILGWMERAAQPLEGQGGQGQGDVFWLYRQDSNEYVLYLPDQDRTITPESITATEEKGADGEISLVLRLRTPENSVEKAPEEQLICFRTDYAAWNGIRVQVILDGRERQVDRLTSKQGKLYTLEESYIGRDRLG